MFISDQKVSVKQHFTENAAFWDELYADGREKQDFYSHEIKRRKEVVFQLLDKFMHPLYERAIDVGCGAGFYVEELGKYNLDIFGSDISPAMIDLTHSRANGQRAGRTRLLCADCENLPFPDEYFDVVLCIGVLSYVPDEVSILNELKRVVKKDGLIIFNVPNVLKLRNMLDPYYYIFKAWKFFGEQIESLLHNKITPTRIVDNSLMETPQNRYTLKQIRRITSKADLQITDEKGYAYGPLRFWRKDILEAKSSFGLSLFLEKLQERRFFRAIKYFPVGWVFVARKSGAQF